LERCQWVLPQFHL